MTQDSHGAELTGGAGVLLVNLGTPDAPTPSAIRRYLRQFLSDPRVIGLPKLLWWPILYGFILPFRPFATAKKYREIWQSDGSPLLAITQRQGSALQTALGDHYQVEVAMRYGNPSIKQALKHLRAKKIDSLIVLPLYPQYAASTVATAFDAVADCFRQEKFLPPLKLIAGYWDHPRYIAALKEAVEKHWQQHGHSEKLLISFHGLPKKSLETGDPYYCLCHKTARLLREALGLTEEEAILCFQSRFGKAPWLEPYTDEVLTNLGQAGHKRVDVICPCFAADCLETLEEICVEFRDVFTNAGGKDFYYIPALNASAPHVELLKTLVTEA